MAKIDFSKFEKDMRVIFDRIMTPDELTPIAKQMADRIVKRTRLGKGVAEDGAPPEPLKPLTDGYKRARKRDKGKGILDTEYASPNRSNLTRTNQMLPSIKPTRASRGKVFIGPTGSRRGSGLTNEKVAEYVSKARPFLHLSKAELNGLIRLFRDRIDEILKELGLTK